MTGRSGFWLGAPGLPASIVLTTVAAAGTPICAFARDVPIAIETTTLDNALTALSRATGVEIVSTEPGLHLVRTPAIRGKVSLRTALSRLLSGTDYRAVSLVGGGFRVVRAPRPSPRSIRSPAVLAPAAGPAPDILITASKQNIPLLRYPGSLTTVVSPPSLSASATGGLSDEARKLPILQSTRLGIGRNKVFIRGVADSSFNGSTQSPTSVYLDDVQLNYSGPDPAMRLYDMRSVEILEGPQGTLYGSGAIGGVVRLSSNSVNLQTPQGSISGGVTATEHGNPGFDLAGVVNLPILDDRLGVRMVAYRVRDGGYIDDLQRRVSDVNRSDTVGGRVAVKYNVGGGWRVEASGAAQTIETQDGQYAERIAGPLARRSNIAQPFSNRLLFGRTVVTKDWASGLHLLSATGIVGYRSRDRFDATPRPIPGAPNAVIIYNASREKRLISQEARLSRSLTNGTSWVAGLTLVKDEDILSRTIGLPDTDVSIIGVTNITNAASLFGEATFRLLPHLSVTAGARGTIARTDGSPSSTPRAGGFVEGRSTRRVDPTVALSWEAAPRVAIFGRFQTGYRTGGLAVAPGIGRVADYRPDAITVGEIGMRKLRGGPTGIALSASASVARWKNIQADLISRRGQPYTDNIGNARIETIEASVDWIPVRGLRAEGSFLFTDNRVTGPIADLSQRNNRRLPETPPLAAHGAVSYEWSSGALTHSIGGSLSYVGRSVLGTGDFLDISQGNYWTSGAIAAVKWQSTEISLTLDNVTNTRANQFAFGNPFTLGMRDQLTPIRPRNLRIGIARRW